MQTAADDTYRIRADTGQLNGVPVIHGSNVSTSEKGLFNSDICLGPSDTSSDRLPMGVRLRAADSDKVAGIVRSQQGGETNRWPAEGLRDTIIDRNGWAVLLEVVESVRLDFGKHISVTVGVDDEISGR